MVSWTEKHTSLSFPGMGQLSVNPKGYLSSWYQKSSFCSEPPPPPARLGPASLKPKMTQTSTGVKSSASTLGGPSLVMFHRKHHLATPLRRIHLSPEASETASSADVHMVLKLGPPVERLEQLYHLFSVVYFSRGTLPPKQGKRALLGDLDIEPNLKAEPTGAFASPPPAVRSPRETNATEALGFMPGVGSLG